MTTEIHFHAEFTSATDRVVIDTTDATRGTTTEQLDLFSAEAKARGYRLPSRPKWINDLGRSSKSWAQPIVRLTKAEREALVGQRVVIDGLRLGVHKGFEVVGHFTKVIDHGAVVHALAPGGAVWVYLPSLRAFARVTKTHRVIRSSEDGLLHLVAA